MKKISILAFAALLFTNKNIAQDSSATARQLTLKECIETAIKNNIDVKRSEYAADANKVDLQQAKGLILPTLNGSVSHGNNQGRSINPYTNSYINQSVNYANYGLDAAFTLFNGLNVQNTIKQTSLAYQAGKMDLQQQRDAVTINVILAYLNVLSNQDQSTQAQQQIDVTRGQLERLDILNKEGAIAPSVYYDLKGQLATNQLSLISSKNALETAKITLAQLMNTDYSENIVLERVVNDSTPSLYDGTVSNIYQQAMANLAIVKAAEYRSQSALKGVLAAKGARYPTLSLNGGLGTNYSSAATLQQLISTTDEKTDGYITIDNDKVPVYAPSSVYDNPKISYGNQWKNNFNSYVGLYLSIPILNGFRARSNLRKAEINVKQYTYEEQTTKLQLKQNIEQAFINMKTALQRFNTLQQQVDDLTESFRAAEVKFEAGVLTSVEYLVVKNYVDQARINLISARYDYILRTKILDYYQSKPLF